LEFAIEMPYDDAAEDADMLQESAQDMVAHQESFSHETSTPEVGTGLAHSAQDKTSGGVESSDHARQYKGGPQTEKMGTEHAPGELTAES